MMEGPKRVGSVLLIAIVLSTGYLDYWAYSQTFYKEPTIWMDVVSGTGSAPNQYRIAVLDTAYFLARHLHVGMRHTLALLPKSHKSDKSNTTTTRQAAAKRLAG